MTPRMPASLRAAFSIWNIETALPHAQERLRHARARCDVALPQAQIDASTTKVEAAGFLGACSGAHVCATSPTII